MTIEVRIDDRLRVAGALLAASDWAEHEQRVKPYRPHHTAEVAHKYFAPQGGHAAAQAARKLAGSGEGLNQLYAHALNGDWPAGFDVEAFQSEANAAAFFEEHQADWAQAEGDAREVLARADLRQFLFDVFGAQARALVCVPQLLYPGRQSAWCASANEMVVCVPPPLAWGTSLPWRYNERPDESLAKISEAFGRCLFEDLAPDDLKAKNEIFALAASVLFLRQAEGEAAGDQFMVMERKTRGLKNLPAVVTALEPLVGQHAALADYLPQIASQL
jgi:hypothetical protein